MSNSIVVTEDVFDTIPDPEFPDDTSKAIPIRRFTLNNRGGMKVEVYFVMNIFGKINSSYE